MTLKKIAKFPFLPDDFVSCKIEVVGLYPNIPHKEGLVAIRIALDTRKDQTISTELFTNFAECGL